jgi:hypothetical protein
VKIVGEAHETAGTDSARMTLVSALTVLQADRTEVVAQVRIEVAGRIVELGRAVLERVGHEVFRDFAACVCATLEAERRRAAGGPGAAVAVAPRTHREGRAGSSAGGRRRAQEPPAVPALVSGAVITVDAVGARAEASGARGGGTLALTRRVTLPAPGNLDRLPRARDASLTGG